jgi:RNA polymerase sigma-70 factor, ECF subfamily
MSHDNRGLADRDTFERVVLPHLDSAYNLARWLVRNPQDAEDVVQEACLRAFKFIGSYQGGDARAWVLKIVRNASYSFLEKKRPAELAVEFDETLHTEECGQEDAEGTLLRAADERALRDALQELPAKFREALILRELEGLSYKEIADVMDVPIGTVMSGLARGRAQLKQRLLKLQEGGDRGVQG